MLNTTASDIEITASDQAGLRAALRKERANEFVYEQKRWLDLARWHNL
ncbi:MAG: RagB/SusD family nutrient uptake outer membrane protein, partial [Prevotellaceae bacterium]|nr:RagB/SusD family nutrient uptake outer membrane protein [Prevotellaceae bacterium]